MLELLLPEFTFSLKLNNKQKKEITSYLETLTADMILFGLRFAYNRQIAINGGYLLPGRKSLIKKETDMLNQEQAKWRLKNWKTMIRTYRERGYSYPTISRIKKEIQAVASDKALYHSKD